MYKTYQQIWPRLLKSGAGVEFSKKMLNSVIDLKTLRIHVWRDNAMGLVDDEYVFFETWHFCIAIHNLLSTAAWQCLCIYIFVSMHDILREKKLIKTFFGIYHHIMYKLFRSKKSILNFETREKKRWVEVQLLNARFSF